MAAETPESLRVLLVQPYAPAHALLADDPLEFSQPLGLMYLAAAMRAQGHQVALADLNLIQATAPKALEPWLEELDPQVVGLSAPFSLMSPAVRDLARFVRRAVPQAAVAVGGAHASACPAEVLAWPEVDLVFLGESEDSFCEYLAGVDLADIDGLAFRQNGQVALNPKRRWIKDLDRLPFPARDLADLTAYWERSGRAGQGRWTSFITSRGCPFACVFCSVHTVWGRRWRPRGPENVVAELRELKERFGLDTLSLEDDNFTLKLDRAKEILRRVLEEGLRFKWATPNGLRADRLDGELIRLMKEAGFTQAKVAIESGHPRVNRKVIGKKLDLDKAKEVVALAAQEGLPPSAFFVLGFPGETPEEMLATVAYALEMRDLGLEGADFFMATPYPGTDLLEQCQKQDLLLLPPEELPLANAFRPSLATADWDAPFLWFMVRLARRAFVGDAFCRELVGRCQKEGVRQVLEQGRDLGFYELGSPQAVFALMGGWHGPEDWPPPMRWSKSSPGLVLNARGQGALAFRLCTHAPRLAEEPMRGRVLVNGHEIGGFTLSDTDWHEPVFELPPDLRRGRLEVEIRLERTFIPQAEDMGDDPRVLGVAMHWVKLMDQPAAQKGVLRGLWKRK